jgi:predicted transcriptional regulator
MTKPMTPPAETPRDEAAFRAAVAAGVASGDAGRTVPYAKVREWLLSWGEPAGQIERIHDGIAAAQEGRVSAPSTRSFPP